ncbi:MAG: hypothetical protein PHW61_02350 [Eubacteriales bacterium]|nr:hypothetical protein [Eubacteriales bacterium]
MPEKRVASIRVGVRLYNAEGQLAVTDMLFQEGDKATGHALSPSEMLVATDRRRRVNAVIHGDTTLVVLNKGTAACGCSITISPITDCPDIALSQGHGAQRLEVGGACAGSELVVDSLLANVALNRVEVAHSGFFPYVQDGMSRHRVAINGAATVAFDFTERDGGERT